MSARGVAVASCSVLAALASAATAVAAPRVYKPIETEPPATGSVTAVAEGVFVTASGEAFADRAFRYRPASGIPGSVVFADVARSGANVVAVGSAGAIWRSTDGGVSFGPVNGTTTYTNSCITGGANAAGPVSVDLFSVKFADPSTVFVTGANATILKSTTAGQVFSEVNKRADGSCLVSSGAPPYDAITDTAWLNATTGFLLSRNFGRYFVTTDGLGSASPRGNATNVADTGGASGQPVRDRPQLAIDPANPSRAWAVNIGSGGSFFVRTTDGGITWSTVAADGANNGLRDVAYAGGTVAAVGDGGAVYRSLDGAKFDREDDRERPTTSFGGVFLSDAMNFVIGGTGGTLVSAEDAPSAVTPRLTFTPATPCTGSGITFDASGSSSTAGAVIGYAWDLDGNGSFETATGSRSTASSVYDFNRYSPPLPDYQLGEGANRRQRAPSFSFPSLVWPEYPIPVRDPVPVRVRVTDAKGNVATTSRTVTFLDGRVDGFGVVERSWRTPKCPFRKTSKLKPATVTSPRSVKMSAAGFITLRVRCRGTRVCFDQMTLRTSSGRPLFRTVQVGFPPGPPVRVALGLTKAGQALVEREGAISAKLSLQDARTRGRGVRATVTLRIRE